MNQQSKSNFLCKIRIHKWRIFKILDHFTDMFYKTYKTYRCCLRCRKLQLKVYNRYYGQVVKEKWIEIKEN